MVGNVPKERRRSKKPMIDDDNEAKEGGSPLSDTLPWFKFNPSDFLNDEAVLLMTNEEVGIYIKLLCRDWIEGSIPTRWEFSARLVGLDPDFPPWERLVELIKPKYIEIEINGIRRLTNSRLDRERVTSRRIRAGAKAASDAAKDKRTEVGAEPGTDTVSEVGPEPVPETGAETVPAGDIDQDLDKEIKRSISGDPREDSRDPSPPKIRDIWANKDGSIEARDGYLSDLQGKYPKVNVREELTKASEWHKTQAPTNRKKRLDRFFVNWLNRCRSRVDWRTKNGGGGSRHATPSRNLEKDLERQRRLEAEERRNETTRLIGEGEGVIE